LGNASRPTLRANRHDVFDRALLLLLLLLLMVMVVMVAVIMLLLMSFQNESLC